MGLAETLLNEYQGSISGLTVVPSLGGVFEVKFAGELVHSKDATGEFPEEEAMRTAFQQSISKVTS